MSAQLQKIKQELNAPDFMKALAENDSFRLDMARQVAFAVQAIEKNPQLQQATPESLRNALINVALTGLSLNPVLQQADLIPRKKGDVTIAVLDPSYKGIITKMNDFGVSIDVFANVVYANDDYEYETHTNTVLKHKTWKQKGLTERGEEVCVYGCILRPDGTRMYRELYMEHINAVMQHSESYKASKRGAKDKQWKSIWEGEWRPQMIAKTMIKYMFKFIPKNERMEALGAIVEMSNYAHEVTDTEVNEQGNEFTRRDTATGATKAAVVKSNTVVPKGERAQVPEDIAMDEPRGIEEVFSTIEESYQLGDRKTRSLPEVVEIKELLREAGVSTEDLHAMLAARTKGVNNIDTLLYNESSANIVLAARTLLTKQSANSTN